MLHFTFSPFRKLKHKKALKEASKVSTFDSLRFLPEHINSMATSDDPCVRSTAPELKDNSAFWEDQFKEEHADDQTAAEEATRSAKNS